MTTQDVKFTIGSDVRCGDDVCGELRRVVIDPVARAVTHLVVEPKHRRGLGRLVPIALVYSTAKQIQLSCTLAEFEALEDADETHFLPGASGLRGYDPGQVLSLPYYPLGTFGGMTGLGGAPPQTIIRDRVPVGEVEVRRGEPVHATDGAIGRVQGLVVDPADHHVTHVLLDEGHLWGKQRITIPINTVTSVGDGVQLNLTKDQVRDLPPIDLADDRETPCD